ncbi:MAG: hypothetical protein J5857_05210 [Treponema sp.]|nr:hypothetical protein [Treponema sp.]
MAIGVLLLCVFNVVMWLVQIVRFKNIFSTDKIMNETRDQLNAMLMDINRNAERNISLIDDRIQKLKEISEEADRHIQLLKGEIALAEKSSEFKSRYELIAHPEPAAPQLPVKEIETQIAEQKPKAQVKPKKPRTKPRTPAAAYKQEQDQGDLFVSSPSQEPVHEPSKMPANAEENESSREQRISLMVESTETNAQSQEKNDFPLITKAKEPLVIKKSFNKEVQELAAQGMKVDEIAAKLGRTIPEVNFALEIS